MCLHVLMGLTNKMRRIKSEKHKVKTFYKVVRGDWSNVYQIYGTHNYRQGWNHSDICPFKLDYRPTKTGETVHKGIHVYTDLETAMRNTRQNSVILKLCCHLDDLIAMGNKNEATFTRVYVISQVT